jgi:Uma2 family endonuclease
MSATEAAPPEVLDPAAIAPNIDHIVTEDDTPVDNMFSEKEQRLLTEALYSSWAGPGEQRPYVVAANVGVFAAVSQPPLVPDVFLSLDVQAPQDLWPKHHRSYFLWEYGKPPEVAIEIVSNRKGQEAGSKMRDYARIGVIYYVIFDPDGQLQGQMLRIYELHAGRYASMAGNLLPEVGLGLTLWQGVFEGIEAMWLRWCDRDGSLIPTGAERADHERERADHERERADHERERADHERERAERLAERLRALGVNPEDV